MRQFILKIIKFALIFLAVLLVCLLIIGIALYMNWPFWVGIFLCIGLFGLLLGIILIRKIWVKHREQHFVKQVIVQDDSRLKTLEKGERPPLTRAPLLFKTQMIKYLEGLKSSGMIKGEDPELIAVAFISNIMGHFFRETIFHETITDITAQEGIDYSIRLFAQSISVTP